jgi:TolA-binding protein
MWKQTLFALILASAAWGQAADYPVGVAAYRAGELEVAERIFRNIAVQDEALPETIKSRYFLARTLMKQRRWEEASSQLIDIHRRDPSFYREWACDFLLGECRKALGRD